MFDREASLKIKDINRVTNKSGYQFMIHEILIIIKRLKFN